MNLIENAKSVLRSSLDVKPGETVLVVTDDTRESIGRALYLAAKELGAEAMFMQMLERSVSGEEPPEPVAAAMAAADVILCPTAKSLTHTNARIQAVKNGARHHRGDVSAGSHYRRLRPGGPAGGPAHSKTGPGVSSPNL